MTQNDTKPIQLYTQRLKHHQTMARNKRLSKQRTIAE